MGKSLQGGEDATKLERLFMRGLRFLLHHVAKNRTSQPAQYLLSFQLAMAMNFENFCGGGRGRPLLLDCALSLSTLCMQISWLASGSCQETTEQHHQVSMRLVEEQQNLQWSNGHQTHVAFEFEPLADAASLSPAATNFLPPFRACELMNDDDKRGGRIGELLARCNHNDYHIIHEAILKPCLNLVCVQN